MTRDCGTRVRASSFTFLTGIRVGRRCAIQPRRSVGRDHGTDHSRPLARSGWQASPVPPWPGRDDASHRGGLPLDRDRHEGAQRHDPSSRLRPLRRDARSVGHSRCETARDGARPDRRGTPPVSGCRIMTQCCWSQAQSVPMSGWISVGSGHRQPGPEVLEHPRDDRQERRASEVDRARPRRPSRPQASRSTSSGR